MHRAKDQFAFEHQIWRISEKILYLLTAAKSIAEDLICIFFYNTDDSYIFMVPRRKNKCLETQKTNHSREINM